MAISLNRLMCCQTIRKRQCKMVFLIFLKIIKCACFQYHTAGIYPGMFLRFPLLCANITALLIERKDLISTGRMCNCHCSKRLLPAMTFYHFLYVNVRQTISVSHQNRLISCQLTHHDQTLHHRRLQTGIHNRNLPVLGLFSMYFHFIGLQIHCNIGLIDIKVHEVILDHFSFVSGTNDKIIVSIMRILLHNVPEHRPTANLCHRFWHLFVLFDEGTWKTSC